MQTCPKCGAQVEDLATICQNCGAQLESKPSFENTPDGPEKPEPVATPSSAKKPPKSPRPAPPVFDVTKRPMAALLTIILLVLGGALMIFFCTPYLIGASQGGVTITDTATSTIFSASNYTTTVTTATSTLTMTTSSLVPTSTATITTESYYSQSLLSAVGLPYFVAGIASIAAGYLLLKRKNLGWRISVVVSVFSIVQTFLLISDAFNLFIGAAILYLQTRPQVKAWLKGPVDVEANKKVSELNSHST